MIGGSLTRCSDFEKIWVGSPTDPKADAKAVDNSDSYLLMVSTVAFVLAIAVVKDEISVRIVVISLADIILEPKNIFSLLTGILYVVSCVMVLLNLKLNLCQL